jgi:hypothetical protein
MCEVCIVTQPIVARSVSRLQFVKEGRSFNIISMFPFSCSVGATSQPGIPRLFPKSYYSSLLLFLKFIGGILISKRLAKTRHCDATHKLQTLMTKLLQDGHFRRASMHLVTSVRFATDSRPLTDSHRDNHRFVRGSKVRRARLYACHGTFPLCFAHRSKNKNKTQTAL